MTAAAEFVALRIALLTVSDSRTLADDASASFFVFQPTTQLGSCDA